MKLLLENWRKYLTEDVGYFGNSFEQFKKRTDGGEHPVKVADEILKRFGEGSTRFAYALPDNPDYVVKTINVELDPGSSDPKGKEFYDADYVNPITGFNRKQKLDSNEWEANLIMQQKYPGIFPRSFEVADDYSWILVERVKPVSFDKMIKILNLPQWFDKRDMLSAISDTISVLRDRYVTKSYNPINNYLSGEEPAQTTYHVSEENRNDSQRTVTVDYKKQTQEPPQIQNVKNILKNPNNRRLFLAAAELNIPPREFLPKNLGLSTIGEEHLVLLDASLWEEPKKGAQI